MSLDTFLGLEKPKHKILIGTSGWDYDDWVGVFYERDDRLFAQYTQVFNTVEINSTFYRYPSPSMMSGLARASPRNFKFAAKIPKDVTHKRKLSIKQGADKALERFLKLLKPLVERGKLGPLLVQLPPDPPSAFPEFDKFLDYIASKEEFKFAIEFRHEKWLTEETFAKLKEHKVAYCIVDEPLLPPITPVTADFAYIRWHGRGSRPWYYYLYSIEELKQWVPKVREVAEKVDVVYGYFNNHFRGFAPRNALQMLQLLGIITPAQLKALRKIEKYFSGKAIEEMKKKALELENPSVRDLLEILAGKKRVERALQISDDEVKLSVSEDIIEARVKDYYVLVDVKGRKIIHDCADWEKRIESKRFCKHLAKVFLMLPEQLSVKVLREILANIDEWDFEVKGA